MPPVDGTSNLLLTDGHFFVQIDPQRTVASDVAGAYLGHRRVTGGVSLVGSVDMQPDGRWRASLTADPAKYSAGFTHIVVNLEDRRDARVTLWQRRHDAFVSHCAL